MSTVSFTGKIRSYGGRRKSDVSPGVAILSQRIVFDPTAASSTRVTVGSTATSEGYFIIPEGALPISFTIFQAATGGTSPTFNLGVEGLSTNWLLADAAADSAPGTILQMGSIISSANATVGVSADGYVTGGVGSSAPTGGKIVGLLQYAVIDDGRDSA